MRADTLRPVRGTAAAARQWWVDGAGSAAALSLLVVVALWVHNRGLQDLAAGPWTALTSLGRVTGLVSADLMLIQVVLMARVPWIERSFGQDQLARWHRVAGFTSFDLLLVHVVLITMGYGATASPPATVVEFWTLITTYPGMLLAAAALVALSMVVVTSVRAARRRLRYESWHLLHLYAYLGIGLALPHQLWTGTEFISSAAARAYWWTFYGLAAGSVLIFRLGLPVWRTLRHRLEVDSVVAEAPGVVSVYLRGRHLDQLPARAGQFLLWRFRQGRGWSRAHPYSLSAPPHRDLLRISVKDLGDDSALVPMLRPGTKVIVEGPYGRLTGEAYRGGPVTMLACGIGITPLLALLWELPYKPGQAVLVYRARDAADFAFRSELDMLSARRGLRVVYLPGGRAGDRTSRRAGGRSWLPGASRLPQHTTRMTGSEVLRDIVPDIARHDVFMWGPNEWMDAARDAALNAGVPDAQLHLERFSW
jgi:predicted ferric reductase